MAESLETSLVITAVGLGLVFACIGLFWLLMSLLVRFVGQNAASPTVLQAIEGDEAAEAARRLRERAAIVGVAVALARARADTPQPFPLPPTALVSTWQAVMRSRALGQRRGVR